MSGLDLDRLKANKEAILKAEIVSMLTLWEKIYPNKINKATINLTNNDWSNLLTTKEIKFKNKNGNETVFNIWDNFLYKWREWRQKYTSNYLLQILYGIGESLNSGIDKGSPKEDIKVEPTDKRWLANPFGSYKRKIIYLKKSEEEVNDLITDIKNTILCNLDKDTISYQDLQQIREKLKTLLSGLLSDDRFPINDVSLWDQTVMPTSMFKALLSNYILTKDDFSKIPDRNTAKWRILGIQYDKFDIAEKCLKLASIQWYRHITEEIDKRIKKLLEVEYPIGNEIYRDETGIYFIVGEDLGEDLNDGSQLAKLKSELRDIEDKILGIFKNKTNDEFYPAIFLTKASRGLMNLGHLLEKSKENFLKVNWKNKDLKLQISEDEKGKAIGICPVCQIRLIYEDDKNKGNKPTICEVCDERIHHKQVSKWIDHISGETIWIDEGKDQNNRVVYVSLKFELDDWLNGDLVNSLLARNEDFNGYLELTKSLLNKIKQNTMAEEVRQLSITEENNEYEKFLSLYDKNGILKPFKEITKSLQVNKNINNVTEENGYRALAERLLKKEDWISIYKFYDVSTKAIIKNKKKNKKESFRDYETKGGIKEHLYKIFVNNYVIFQIYKTLLERSIGQKWEEFINKQLNDWDNTNNTPLKQKIDFDNRKINWDKLTDDDIYFLATLLLQFLLRKNPSPARLRRIWETTREFFEDIHNNLETILEIPEWRKKRLIWEVELNENNKLEKSMELEADELLFWAEKRDNNTKIYLISSIRDFLLKYGNGKVKKALEKNEYSLLNQILSSKESLKQNLEDKTLTLKPYESKNDDKNQIEIRSNEFKEIKDYKPFTKITVPSPKSYQIVIPSEYIDKFIDKVMERYNNEFKYVYGKLPIHIGIVISNYKKPVYVNLKALRKIRRDVKDTDKLFITKDVKEFCILQKKKLSRATLEEKINKTESYYSLYLNNPNTQKYNFYIRPHSNWKKWISTIDNFPTNSNVEIIPNTFDFEFMDTNTRRNDIFYDKEKNYKRALEIKSNRPYEIEKYWEKFKKFKEIFKNKTASSKLHKLIHLLYEKSQNFNKNYASLLATAFINTLELNKVKEMREEIASIFDIGPNIEDIKDFHTQLKEKLKNKENIKLFIDMFEFWHTALKEV